MSKQRLDQYAVAAVAAGVGVLALAQPTDAKVIITVKNIPIPSCFVQCSPTPIDLNKDGIADFQFSLNSYTGRYFLDADLTVKPLAGGEVVGHGPYGFASALLPGAKIGPLGPFAAGTELIESSTGFYQYGFPYVRNIFGKWSGNHPNRFLGVKLLINGATHYGWVRLTVVSGPKRPMSATITEYGSETDANEPVFAGKTSTTQSLGALALGADGIEIWRKEGL